MTKQIGEDAQPGPADAAEPATDALDAAVAALKLLADRTRLRIVWQLLHGEHSVNDLAAHIGIAPAAVSHHLAKLRLAG